jgi:hypothetical protein
MNWNLVIALGGTLYLLPSLIAIWRWRAVRWYNVPTIILLNILFGGGRLRVGHGDVLRLRPEDVPRELADGGLHGPAPVAVDRGQRRHHRDGRAQPGGPAMTRALTLCALLVLAESADAIGGSRSFAW